MAPVQLLRPTNTPQQQKRPLDSGRISAGQRVEKLPAISYGQKR